MKTTNRRVLVVFTYPNKLMTSICGKGHKRYLLFIAQTSDEPSEENLETWKDRELL